MLFHLFSDHQDKKVESVVCNLGSDIFNCIKLNTAVFSKGGYLIDFKGKKIINPELNEFKKEVIRKVVDLYYENPKFNHYRLDESKINDAIDLEFMAEAE